MMKFSLIICTYMRPKALITLLNSVKKQILYPNEIIIIDGSTNNLTKEALKVTQYFNLKYFKVDEKDRGLTKQRNFGIQNVSDRIEVICFLDDDVILTEEYFENLIKTYAQKKDAKGVGGYITNEVSWRRLRKQEKSKYSEFEIDGWVRNLGLRNLLRKRLGLLSNEPPGIMPEYSNGLSISSFPPNNKIYEVEYFMGGVSSFKKEIVDSFKFSTYFEGYGLYEDLEYCLRVSKKHKLYVNTAAQLTHHHEEGGRPNQFLYGKMVMRNGWYVWRVKYKNPKIIPRLKWNIIGLLLTIFRFSNIITSRSRFKAVTESLGRVVGWWSLIFHKPKVIR